MRTATAALTVAALAASLTGCGGPDDADVTACETFGEAHNALVRSLDGTADTETVQALSVGLTDAVADAADVAADPDLAIQLGDAADYAGDGITPGASNADAGTAYWLTATDTFATCQDLGVDIEEAALPPE